MTTPKVFTEGRRAAEFIISEGEHLISRDNLVFADEAIIEPGTVIGSTVVAATTDIPAHYTALGASATAVIGILIEGWDGGSYVPVTGDARACAVLTRYAEVNGNLLKWPDGISANNKATAIANLAARGIIVR